MAKAKTAAKGSRFSEIKDEAGDQWHGQANEAWSRAVEEAGDPERAVGLFRRFDPERDEERLPTMAPDLPDFAAEASPAVAGEVLGRFVYVAEDGLVHDTTKAVEECRVDRTPRVFIHFAQEIEGAVPEDAGPCPACMA